MALQARPVDPRVITVEESDPTYRVYFWAQDGRRCREYDVNGVDDVEEVIAWADANVETDETYILGVRWPESFTRPGNDMRSVAFVRLKGDSPPGHFVGKRQG